MTNLLSGIDRTADLEAARLLLDRMGITPEDLLGPATARQQLPTFAEYIPQVRAAVKKGSRATYSSYWNRIVAAWAERRIDEPTPTEIQQMVEQARTHALVRRNTRGGRGAAIQMVSAFRCLYKYAVADGLIAPAENPARKVDKPRQLPGTRCALPEARLAEVNQVAASTGNDPELDTLLLRLHTETACRRAGALALRPCDLDPDQCLIRLREKGETERWQPVSPTLMTHLRHHVESRNSPHTGQLLRYRGGKPITTARYDGLWNRIRQQLPWAAAQQTSMHWIRHTTLTWVERNFGYATAKEYAGHTDRAGKDTGATATYVKATINDVASALAALTGEPHPLALTGHLDP